MANSRTNSLQPATARQWVFPWKPAKQPLFPKLFALCFSCGLFLFLITAVRVKVSVPPASIPRNASVIHLKDDEQGRDLTLRAREGGPSPSRFELAQWQGLADLEIASLDEAKTPPFRPFLLEDPAERIVSTPDLAAKGERFFPVHRSSPPVIAETGKTQIAPALYPLSVASAGMLPEIFPPFVAPATPEVRERMFSASWRFLVQLNADGSVEQCTSLEKGLAEGTDEGGRELTAWLQSVLFRAEPSEPVRWLTLEIGFTNQLADGPDPR